MNLNLELKLKLFITLALLTAQCSLMAQSTATRLEKTVIFKVKPEFRNLCFDSSIEDTRFTALISSLGTYELRKKFPEISPPRTQYNEDGIPLADLSLIYEMSYTSSTLLEKVIRAIDNLAIVQYAQPHHIPKPLYIPNDDPAKLSDQYYLSMIRAYAAWDSNKGDSTIVIGITDTGVDTSHIDLKNNLAYNYADPIDGIDNDGDGWIDNYRGWDMADNDNDPTSTGIFWHHGTAVAGLAAASTDNGIQGAGVGFKCRFLPVKVSRNSDGAFTGAYEGIVYAASHGCQIINCSWGGINEVGQFEQDIIDFATVNKNALVIAAAGNSGDESVFYPASLNYVISVGGTDSTDVKFNVISPPAPATSRSNYGRHLDICAPGAYIYSTSFASNFSLVNTGTSYSSPILAGCAAIVKSKFPNYTALQIGEQLKVTADTIDTIPGNANFVEKLGSGRVNLFNAITDSTKPSIVMIKSFLTDGNNDQFSIGDTVRIRGTFKNYLAPTKGLSAYVKLSTTHPNVTVDQFIAALGPLNTLDTSGVYALPLTFTVDSGMGSNESVELRFEYSDSNASTIGYEYMTIVANPNVLDLDVNDISTSMTSQGRIGFNDPTPPDPVLGLGFQFKGENLIFEAGLMVGAQIGSTTYVSDNIWDSVSTDTDFMEVLRANKVAPSVADIETHAIVNDDGAGIEKMDISVDHNYYAWSNSPDENYILMRYNIINNGSDSLMSLYAGLSVDWDIRNFSVNKATHDLGSRMGYVRSTEAGSPYAGVKLLSAGPYIHYAIDNYAGAPGIDIFFPNAYSTAKKYTALSTNRSQAGGTGSGNDVIDVVSSGPFTLAPQDTLSVSFAMLAGDDLLDLVNGAFAAQAMYDSLFGEPEDTTTSISMLPIVPKIELYPNPSQGVLNLFYSEAKSQPTTFEIVDLTGRLVYASNLDIGMVLSTHDVSHLRSGIYQYRVRSLEFERNGKLVIAQ